MTVYLNTKRQFENYKELSMEEYFINKKISTKNKHVCITRAWRFDKSSIADILGAYYSNATVFLLLGYYSNISNKIDLDIILNSKDIKEAVKSALNAIGKEIECLREALLLIAWVDKTNWDG